MSLSEQRGVIRVRFPWRVRLRVWWARVRGKQAVDISYLGNVTCHAPGWRGLLHLAEDETER